jgi:murein DD-endopeptidase
MAPPRKSSFSPLSILLVCSLALNAYLLLTRGSSDDADLAASASQEEELALAEGTEGEEEAAAPGAQPEPDAPAAAPSSAPSSEWAVIQSSVNQNLARTFQIEAGEDGDALASVFTRLFVWDLDMRRDLQAGDAVGVVWRKSSDGMPEVAAGKLQSKRLGKTLVAYRWKSPDDKYASYWRLDGTEAPLRLKNGPLEQYEQITSLLKDRPSHKGMDFKTPVGTEVRSPRKGKVTRANWNWSANGNCIEIQFDDGVLAKFLHLSENKVKEGEYVDAGHVIALTGNTGRSTAPHLHYQLDRGNETLDPLEYHGTMRRSLHANDIAALKRDVASFDEMLTKGQAVGQAASADPAL